MVEIKTGENSITGEMLLRDLRPLKW